MTYLENKNDQFEVEKLCDDIKQYANKQYGMVKSRELELKISFIEALLYFFNKRFLP